MSNSLRCLIGALALSLLAPPAVAELCTVDAVPAATLLVPYIEVNLTKKRNVNTVVSIQNTTAEATIAHVTLWTDWAVPTLSFDVFLTGYDTVEIDLWELFNNGTLPVTAHATNDPNDAISPHGTQPNWDSAPDSSVASLFAGCDPVLPLDPLSRSEINRLRASHRGQDTGDGCVGANHGDNSARGYVTIDNATDCSSLYPGESGYFGSGGVASNVNQLRGDYFITSRAGKGLAAAQAVAVEASMSSGSGYTFYGRYVGGTDGREPLGTSWNAHWPDKLPFGRTRPNVQTELLVWRDTKYSGLEETFRCGSESPPWLPLDETQVVAFNEDLDFTVLCGDPDVDCAPLATQRLTLGEGDWQTSVGRGGWYFANLNHSYSGPGSVDFGGLAQSYVSVLTTVQRLRGNTQATELTSACGGSGTARRRSRRR